MVSNYGITKSLQAIVGLHDGCPSQMASKVEGGLTQL